MPEPPDYIGLGARGTAGTWWHELLLRHPSVRGPSGRRRELGFFTAFCRREMRDEDVARYHRRFPRRPGEVSGEWTPGYLHQPWTPVLLRRAAPEAKLLVMLRDPVEQYRARLAEARAALGPGEAHRFVVDAVGRVRHAEQLRALRDVVAPERILVLQQERCVADPAGEYRRTLRFLGVPADPVPGDVGAPPPLDAARRPLLRRRRSLEPVELWPAIEATLRVELGPEVEALAAMVPELRLDLWPAFAR